MKKALITTLVLAVLVGAGYAIWVATKPKVEAGANGPGPAAGPGARNRGPATVRTVPVKSEPVPFVLDAVGTVEAERSVAVRSETTGTLQRIFFREGDLVERGQLLFQVDPALAQADVERVRANLARDQATLAEARAQSRRLAPLAAKEYVTRQEYAAAQAQEQAAAATSRANQAELKTAQIQLARTRIHAPIRGRVGALAIKEGNLVTANAQDPLVTINAISPALVAFTTPQQTLGEIRARHRAAPLAVEIRRNADEPMLAAGQLAFIDNTIDPQTGTIRIKARVNNDNEAIWPGELVAVRLILGIQDNAVVVPEAAVQPGQQGSFVYVVDQGKAKMQPITIARQVETRVVVAKGVRPGQQVIINPPQNLRPGAPVKVQKGDGSARQRGAPRGEQPSEPRAREGTAR